MTIFQLGLTRLRKLSHFSNHVLILTFAKPHNTRWLSPAQRRLAQVRLAEDAGEADEDSANESCVTSALRGILSLTPFQHHAWGETGVEGPEGLYLLGHGLCATPGTELRQLLPYVSTVCPLIWRIGIDQLATSLTATLGFSTTVSLLLAA